MTSFTGVMVYVIIWFVVLFTVLPFGVRRPEHVEEGPRPRRARQTHAVAQGRDHHGDRDGALGGGVLPDRERSAFFRSARRCPESIKSGGY